ncbi:hypothetical protein, partial [Acinetobacter baumannii]|uniref:hypothetical protein n=1 Tax=Acinetobacter baumannii TaxID=470 RepID=UPI001C08FBF8
NKPLSVEEVRNLKRDAERKIDDILETLCKELGPRSHIEVVTFDFDEMQRIIAGKRYNTKIKVFIS